MRSWLAVSGSKSFLDPRTVQENKPCMDHSRIEEPVDTQCVNAFLIFVGTLCCNPLCSHTGESNLQTQTLPLGPVLGTGRVVWSGLGLGVTESLVEGHWVGVVMGRS